jgi:hypothetical protein
VSVSRLAGIRCANTITEYMIRSHRKKTESTSTAFRLKRSLNLLGYRNTLLLIILNTSKMDIAGTRGRRV